MATLKAAFVRVKNRAGLGGETMPTVDLSTAERIANLTTTNSSQRLLATGGGDWVAPDGNGFIYLVADAAVDVVAGANPTASASAGISLAAGVPFTFSIAEGHRVAAVNG